VNSWPETVALGGLLLGAASCGGSIAEATSDGGGSVGLDATIDVVRSGVGVDVDATSDASASTDAEGGTDDGIASCVIQTSHYEQSCVVDTDCVTEVDYPYAGLGPGPLVVQSGDYCGSLCLCQGDVIARSSVAQYVADVRRTPVGAGAVSPQICNCSRFYYPCCLSGRCVGACYAEELDGGVDGGVVCGLRSGPIARGNPGAEPFLVCRPPESCTSIGDHWECCSSLGGGLACFPPRQADGGSSG
jgi:hypothetical protein